MDGDHGEDAQPQRTQKTPKQSSGFGYGIGLGYGFGVGYGFGGGRTVTVGLYVRADITFLKQGLFRDAPGEERTGT